MNARIAIDDVKPVMSQSCPSIQIDAPRDVTLPFKPVWLRRNWKQMDAAEAEVFANKYEEHYGLFQYNNTWALRVPSQLYEKIKADLGQCPIPLYRISNLPSHFIDEDVADIVGAIDWKREVMPQSLGFGREALNFW